MGREVVPGDIEDALVDPGVPGAARSSLAHHRHTVPPAEYITKLYRYYFRLAVHTTKGSAVSAELDILHTDRPKRVLLVASDPSTSTRTGWPIAARLVIDELGI